MVFTITFLRITGLLTYSSIPKGLNHGPQHASDTNSVMRLTRSLQTNPKSSQMLTKSIVTPLYETNLPNSAPISIVTYHNPNTFLMLTLWKRATPISRLVLDRFLLLSGHQRSLTIFQVNSSINPLGVLC